MDEKQITQDVIDRMKEITGCKSDIELSTRLGGSKTMISNRKIRGSVPFHEAMDLAITTGASLDWLILGRRGEDAEPLDGPVLEPVMSYRPELLPEDLVQVPLYDLQAAAGGGRLFDQENVRSTIFFRRDWVRDQGLFEKDLVALSVCGDSMDGTLQEGDTVLVNRAQTQGDGVFVLRLGDALRIKRVQRLANGGIRLSSDNDYYTPEVVHPDEQEQVEILGHCYWRGGRVY